MSGVIDALLAWLIRSAAGRGARTLQVPSALNARNVPLRLALAAAAFRAPGAGPDPTAAGAADAQPADVNADQGGKSAGGRQVVYRRSRAGPLPELPGWLTGPAGSPRAEPADSLPAGPADSPQASIADGQGARRDP